MKTVEQNTEVGVIVARFQSPELHEGHQDIINLVRNTHPRVIIFLGLSPLRCTKNNPYDFSIRKAMIEEKYKDVEILYIDDVGDNSIWSANLDRLVAKNVGPGQKATLYGSRDSFIKAYSGRYPTVELVPNRVISASEIRKKIAVKPLTSSDFRKGIVYAVENQFPTIHPTVDCAIVDFEKKRILLGKKSGQIGFRFPGGFLDPLKDKTAEEAAIRESKEETKLSLTVDKYLGSLLVNDWRYRHEQNKIMTFFYLLLYDDATSGRAEAGDDLELVMWKEFGTVDLNDIVSAHHPLMCRLDSDLGGKLLKK
jgi:bifunctional NMN adenylyltransferase/nudix hydrolase